jgi:Na(+)-translocating NADH:ubiquinone oxidoreductase A subunit
LAVLYLNALEEYPLDCVLHASCLCNMGQIYIPNFLLLKSMVSDGQICIIWFRMQKMKFKGGYNIYLQGKPERKINQIPEPQVIYLPLESRRFKFTQVYVKDGQMVTCGQILAADPDNYNIPLLAPTTGRVQLNHTENHIVLEDIQPFDKEIPAQEQPSHIAIHTTRSDLKREQLLSLGAWQFFYDAFSGLLSNPASTPQAVIVSTLSLEPFLARGDIQLRERLLNFTRGLEQLQSLLEYQPIYLIMPKINSELATKVHEQIRGYAWAEMVEIPLIYPYDNFNILARHLGLKKNDGPVWAIRTEGIIAIDTALTLGKPCIKRIISVAGPAVIEPTHLEVIIGYPLNNILKDFVSKENVRIINGGVMTGKAIDENTLGLDTECTGLTVLNEHNQREFLAFIRPGTDRSSYSGCFLSKLRKQFPERLNTATRGELRPCISCNFCEELCPADIMPHLIHKYLYADLIDEAEQARIDLCIECGLCSFVCPSKIDLKSEFFEAKRLIKEEKEQIRKEQQQKDEMQNRTSRK